MRFCFLEIAVKETMYPKTTGNFKKQNFDARRNISYCIAVTALFRASQPNGLGCSEVTKSAQCFWFKRSFAMPTSKTAKAVFVGFCSVPRGQPAELVCSEVTKSAHSLRFMRGIVSPTSKTICRFWNCGAKASRWYAAASACHPEGARRASRSFA